MSLWSKIRGTIETAFQLGLGGPQLKNNAGAIEARNAGDSAFAVVRGGAAVADNDLTTKQYVDTLFSRSVVSAQFDGNNAIPANTGTERFLIVTTTGANATIGQLLWDDGSGAGNMVVLAAKAQMVITTTAFSGGTITLKADTPYVWDTVSTSWVNAGGTSLSGAVREIRYAITNAASQDSASQIPANAQVVETQVEIVTPYSGGATISVGQAGSLTLLQVTADNLATAAGIYETPQDVAWGGAALAVRVTVGGAPAAGAGFAIVRYTQPDA
jgi:hypothetical protein